MIRPVAIPFKRAPWVSYQNDICLLAVASGDGSTADDPVGVAWDEIGVFEGSRLVSAISDAACCHHIVILVRKLNDFPYILSSSVQLETRSTSEVSKRLMTQPSNDTHKITM